MRLLISQRRCEEPIYTGKYFIYILKAHFLFIGVNVYIHVLRGHLNIQHIYGKASLHEHAAVCLTCSDRNGIVAYHPAVYNRRLIIPVMFAISRFTQISAYLYVVELLFVIDKVIA